jgi:hypothetical protein
MTTQFKTGSTYATRSICDHDSWFSFEILARTAKTVTIKVNGSIVRRGLSVFDGVEQFKPYGTYSMCAVIGADDLAPWAVPEHDERKAEAAGRRAAAAYLAGSSLG